MNSINFLDGRLSIYHKDNCDNVRGALAKGIAFGLTTYIVIGGITAVLEKPN